MSFKKGYSFKNRYLITGLLTVRTPLHIGSGDTTTHPELKVDDNEFIEISAVAKDVLDKPYIPASTLKGNLRAWLETRVKDKSLLEKVFGTSHQDKNTEGGKVEFWDAYITEKLPEARVLSATKSENMAVKIKTKTPQVISEKNEQHFPYWNPEKQTGVQVGVTIDRQTGTARDERLFYWEVVPPGVTFEIRITGQDLNKKEIALLLANLKGFNDSKHPVSLGSETAQNQGKMHWHSFKVQSINAIAWLNKPDHERKMWFNSLQTINKREEDKLIKLGNNLIHKESTRPILRLHLSLQFDSPFLVNDPSKEKKGEHNFQPRRDAEGKVLLPAKSLRGAIRSQAERIIRTLGAKACCIDNMKSACPPPQKHEKIEEKLCLACQLFGATGWQTPIRISDFTLVQTQGEFDQDFVAIDRFTGGGSEGAKFRATVANAPLLEGVWNIDLQRVEPWGLGLLALVIRDLIEGDISFGYGAAKGYGHCYARLQDWSVNALPSVEDCPDWKAKVEKAALNPETPQGWHNDKAIILKIQNLINHFVKDFQKKCS